MPLFEPWLADRSRKVVFGSQTLTAGDLLQEAEVRRRRLAAAGVQSGDLVIAMHKPGSDFFFWLAALIAQGVKLLSLNPNLSGEQKEAVLSGHPSAWFLAPSGALFPPAHIRQQPPSHSEPIAERHTLFELHLQTSGTTGVPKTAVLPWRQLEAHARASAAHLHLRPDDTWLACLPVHHIGGLSILFRSIILGCRLDIQNEFDPDAVTARIDGGAITHASVVPTMLKRLLDARQDRAFPPSLRMLLTGGAALPAPLAERARAVRAPVAPTYGMTETGSQVCTLLPHDFLAGKSGCGRPLPSLDIQVRDEAGHPVSEGIAGMIAVHGPTVMAGYAGFPPVDEWFVTGDIGLLRDGSLHILDRRSDLIVTGGENVYPTEVENVLRRHPGVADCAVVGLPDETWGKAVVAVIEADFVDAVDLRAFCKSTLAPHQIPKRFFAVGALPRTASGKIQRDRVRSMIQETAAAGLAAR